VGDDTAVAIAGAGAWMIDREGSRRRLHVAPAVPVEEMVASLSWRYLAEPLQSRVLHRLSRVAASPDYRCAAHQYRMLAGGHAHAMSFGRLYPWDHAAGFLLHREAGGYARQFDGGEYKPSVIDGGLLLTPDEPSWHALAEAILR
jgi:fructose-1,6-bisphosphatase/inositol monophosphatase family enzyme